MVFLPLIFNPTVLNARAEREVNEQMDFLQNSKGELFVERRKNE